MAAVGRHRKYLAAAGEDDALVATLVGHADELRARGCQLCLVAQAEDGVWLTEVWASAEQRDAAPAPAGIDGVAAGPPTDVAFAVAGEVAAPAAADGVELNDEEWSAIVSAPVGVAASIIAADGGGSMREALSLARAYQEALASNPAGSMLKRVLHSPPMVDLAALRGGGEQARQHGFARLRTALDAIERKGDAADLADYRGFVAWLAETVARAHREGGFLGIGGKEISDAEQQVLDELATLLR